MIIKFEQFISELNETMGINSDVNILTNRIIKFIDYIKKKYNYDKDTINKLADDNHVIEISIDYINNNVYIKEYSDLSQKVFEVDEFLLGDLLILPKSFDYSLLKLVLSFKDNREYSSTSELSDDKKSKILTLDLYINNSFYVISHELLHAKQYYNIHDNVERTDDITRYYVDWIRIYKSIFFNWNQKEIQECGLWFKDINKNINKDKLIKYSSVLLFFMLYSTSGVEVGAVVQEFYNKMKGKSKEDIYNYRNKFWYRNMNFDLYAWKKILLMVDRNELESFIQEKTYHWNNNTTEDNKIKHKITVNLIEKALTRQCKKYQMKIDKLLPKLYSMSKK